MLCCGVVMQSHVRVMRGEVWLTVVMAWYGTVEICTALVMYCTAKYCAVNVLWRIVLQWSVTVRIVAFRLVSVMYREVR